MDKSLIIDELRTACESSELELSALNRDTGKLIDSGKFDDALVFATDGRRIYGAKLFEAYRSGKIGRSQYESVSNEFNQRMGELISEIKVARKNYLDRLVNLYPQKSTIKELPLD